MKRTAGRRWNEMRQIKITRDFITSAQGSTLIEMGNTRVICTASIEDRVPPFFEKFWKRVADGRICHASYVYILEKQKRVIQRQGQGENTRDPEINRKIAARGDRS